MKKYIIIALLSILSAGILTVYGQKVISKTAFIPLGGCFDSTVDYGWPKTFFTSRGEYYNCGEGFIPATPVDLGALTTDFLISFSIFLPAFVILFFLLEKMGIFINTYRYLKNSFPIQKRPIVKEIRRPLEIVVRRKVFNLKSVRKLFIRIFLFLFILSALFITVRTTMKITANFNGSDIKNADNETFRLKK